MKAFAPGLFRGPRPDPNGRVFRDELARAGVRTILNLETHGLDWNGDERCSYTDLAFRFSIATIELPMGVFDAPSVDRLRLAVRIIMDADGPLYVHCREGVDRTGMVVAAYRMSTGWSLAGARDEMIAEGFHLGRYFFWLPRLDEFSTALGEAAK